MAVQAWGFTPQEWSDAANALPDPEVGGLISWAMRAVEALHYLGDVDDRVFADPERPAQGHPLQAVDLGHMTWACVTAITALDRCAAAAWRIAVPRSRGLEKSVRDFGKPQRRQMEENRRRLDPSALAWIDGVLDDPAYTTVLRARNPMTHARLRQMHFAVVSTKLAAHAERSAFYVGARGAEVGSRALIEMATDLATRHVEGFMAEVIL